ncbi:hypothetical protein CYMTET_34996 [Cymbomonas tetramitiformis]|uniref:Uncharacterized protein n=1 Tax=Cymbomonas tetramitiformis TaxID=36881 RepID=A0AAE0KPM0_9CHLO|nr:hypothetical protein CYMTET_34996 [Cymbomonas tetramitiformis]
MPGDIDVLNAANGYETANCFIGDALRTHAQHTADILHVNSGSTWIEDAQGHPASFLHWAVPCVYEALLDRPPAAIVDEIRIIVATRSPEVLWALFGEEVQIALKLRGTFSPHSRPLQRWTRASKLFSRELKTTIKWRSGDALVAEARSREAQVAMQLLGEAREYMCREGLSLQRSASRAAREPHSPSSGPMSPVKSVMMSVTQAAANAAKSAMANELADLRLVGTLC